MIKLLHLPTGYYCGSNCTGILPWSGNSVLPADIKFIVSGDFIGCPYKTASEERISCSDCPFYHPTIRCKHMALSIEQFEIIDNT